MAKKVKLPSDYFDFKAIGISIDGYTLTGSEMAKGYFKWTDKKKTKVKFIKK